MAADIVAADCFGGIGPVGVVVVVVVAVVADSAVDIVRLDCCYFLFGRIAVLRCSVSDRR